MFRARRGQLFQNIKFSVGLDCSSKCLINVLTLPAFMCRFRTDKNSLWFVIHTISRMTFLKGKKVAGLSLLFGLRAAPKNKNVEFLFSFFNLVDCFTFGGFIGFGIKPVQVEDNNGSRQYRNLKLRNVSPLCIILECET